MTKSIKEISKEWSGCMYCQCGSIEKQKNLIRNGVGKGKQI
jgi:hypothetical protein